MSRKFLDWIIHEDADLLVINKPAGLLTSTVPREKRPTLVAMVSRYLDDDKRARIGLIHRLDRDAGGVLVFSKNPDAYHALKTQFYHHEVDRVYTAWVYGTPKPPAGRIESYLVERADGTVYSTRLHGKGQQAITEYETIKTAGSMTLLRVTLHTGRKHQIRVHLSEKKWPIVGDSVYGKPGDRGKKGEKPPNQLMLTATRLGITHPRTGRRMNFEIKPPTPP